MEETGACYRGAIPQTVQGETVGIRTGDAQESEIPETGIVNGLVSKYRHRHARNINTGSYRQHLFSDASDHPFIGLLKHADSVTVHGAGTAASRGAAVDPAEPAQRSTADARKGTQGTEGAC